MLKEEYDLFQKLLDENRYDFCKLVYLIFPFGVKGTSLEHMAPYEWQMEEWKKLSDHLKDPKTRYDLYRLIISSGNGAAKTAFGAITNIVLLYTHKLRARITANTDPQMRSIIWPEYDVWFRAARFNEFLFEKQATSIKAKNPKLAETWRIDTVNWSEQSPASISGLHNKGHAVSYTFEEAPGIPANIWGYTSGAFTETDTIKIHMAFGNSDDPESKFEQNMTSPLWNARRIDTRELKHIDQKQVRDWLVEAGGNEDHDDFRVRVRGLPRKSAKDSIIKLEHIEDAIERRKGFDPSSVSMLPCVLTCDPAWTGGDETTIWYQQGNYKKLLERFKLSKADGDTHMVTYNRLIHWEKELGADAVFIDQGEGTALYTLAMNNYKTSWYLVAFNAQPTDNPDRAMSPYANIRAQMHYQLDEWLCAGGIIDAAEESWLEDIKKQFCWAKGARHKVTGKKLAEPKADIKDRVGHSPDLLDGAILAHAHKVTERLPENDIYSSGNGQEIGTAPLSMPEYDPYENMDDDLYN